MVILLTLIFTSVLARVKYDNIQMDIEREDEKLRQYFSLAPSDFEVSEQSARKQYEHFLLKYPKTSSLLKDDADYRFQTFWRNLQRIMFHNHVEQGTAIYRVNEFADMSQEEFAEKFFGLKYDAKVEKVEKQKYERKKKLRRMDESFDWTERGAVTEVKNQGMCGSCWAFSTTGNIEGTWFLATGDLIELSEQELVDCDVVDSGCQGGLMDNAFEEIIRLGGLETEQDYVYDAHQEACTFDRGLAKVYINSSMDIGEDEGEIAEALVDHGPLSIALNAFGMQYYHSGVSHPFSFLCSPEGLDHGVLLVGYGVEHHTNYIHRNPRPYWKIKNSWGPTWGEDGYYRIYRGEGVCGVNKYVTTSIVNIPPETTTTTDATSYKTSTTAPDTTTAPNAAPTATTTATWNTTRTTPWTTTRANEATPSL